MQFQVKEHNGDYIVEAYIIEDIFSTRGYWHPLRNFGSHQGDAFAFRDYDCPRLPDTHIKALIRAYKPEVKYSRISSTKFVKQAL